MEAKQQRKGAGGNRRVAGEKGQEDRHTVSQCLCVYVARSVYLRVKKVSAAII